MSQGTHITPATLKSFKDLFEALCIQIPDFTNKNIQNKKNEYFINEVFKHYALASQTKKILFVSIYSQILYLINNKELISHYPISSAEAGIGNLSGSLQTPLGIHQISEKIGENAPIASIFKGRVNINQTAAILSDKNTRSNQDNITSRILRLEGLEESLNKGYNLNSENIDSFSRYIYIHGTDEEGYLGQPASHGCIRMGNQDIINLFEVVSAGDLVVILEQ